MEEAQAQAEVSAEVKIGEPAQEAPAEVKATVVETKVKEKAEPAAAVAPMNINPREYVEKIRRLASGEVYRAEPGDTKRLTDTTQASHESIVEEAQAHCGLCDVLVDDWSKHVSSEQHQRNLNDDVLRLRRYRESRGRDGEED